MLAIFAEDGAVPVAGRGIGGGIVVFTFEGREVERELAAGDVVEAEAEPGGLAVASAGILLAADVEAEFGLGDFFDEADRGRFVGGVEKDGFGRGRGGSSRCGRRGSGGGGGFWFALKSAVTPNVKMKVTRGSEGRMRKA